MKFLVSMTKWMEQDTDILMLVISNDWTIFPVLRLTLSYIGVNYNQRSLNDQTLKYLSEDLSGLMSATVQYICW